MERKKLSDIAWNVSEEVYRNDPALSYSTLAKYERGGFDSLPTLFDKVESPSLLFGSVVDTLVTGTPEEFDERYKVLDLPKMSDSLLEIANMLYERFGSVFHSFDDLEDDMLASVGAECNYYSGDSYKATRVKNIKKSCKEYYDALASAEGKQVISTELYVDASRCVEALKESKATSWLFAEDTDKKETYFQLKFKSEYNGIDLRCMADCIVVDHTTKTIYPFDLKTSSKPEYMFYKSFIQWSYMIQAQLYWYIIRKNMDNDPIYKDYKLADYTFIVVNRNTLIPLTWTFKDTTVTEDLVYGDIKCRNWRKIAEELNYYLTAENVIVPRGITLFVPNDIVGWLMKDSNT